MFFFQEEDGIRDLVRSRGLGDVYKRQLQAQLGGTENRITESRRQYNEAAQDYNASRSKFPRVIFASLFGFNTRPYFEADKGSEKAPEVKF